MTTRLAGFLAVALSLAPAVRAQSLDLVVTPTPIDLTAGQVSPNMTVSVVQNPPINPSNFFMGWQVGLTIQPDAGAIGEVTFNSPGPGLQFPPRPANYVFTGPSGGISSNNGDTTLDAADISFSGSYNVSGAPGRNLLTINVTSSADAAGSFGVFARRGVMNTGWTDNSGVSNNRAFNNVPSGSGLVRLGTINVTPIPEPMTCTAVLLAGLGVAGAVRRFRRRAVH
jgi:hypothetical protein